MAEPSTRNQMSRLSKSKRLKHYFGFFVCCALLLSGCDAKEGEDLRPKFKQYITVLGIAQDAGYPQIQCRKACCLKHYEAGEPRKMVSCLGLVDLEHQQKWLFDATPDIGEQMHRLDQHFDSDKTLDGIFLTHAHIGHYTGLMQLGFEAMNARAIPVYAMPAMRNYLETNGPWSQLVSKGNIQIESLQADSTLNINDGLKVTPIRVPHRDEYSETVGYRIEGPSKSALFIPDIDKWERWDRDIVQEVSAVDYSFLDATFFKDGELPRPMSEIPHPFVMETVNRFKDAPASLKSRIYFIHFNHTNPAVLESHRLKDSISQLGFNFAEEGQNFEL